MDEQQGPAAASRIKGDAGPAYLKGGVLAETNPEAFAAALTRLLLDPHLRRRLGERGAGLISAGHAYSNFRQRLAAAYDLLGLGGEAILPDVLPHTGNARTATKQ